MNGLIKELQEKLNCNMKEAHYIYDLVKSYSFKESDSHYSLLPELLQIIEGDFSYQDRINDLGIILSLFYKNDPDYQGLEINGSFIKRDLENNMPEFYKRLSDSELNDLVKKIESLYVKL
jgi:hypothetical protein